MNCPKCRAPLKQVEIYDQTFVHTCPNCSGTFYTESELAVPHDLDGAKPAKWPCPACSSAMETGTVCDGKVELDRCTDCGGFWFDAGELATLSQLTGVKRVTKPVGAVGDFEEPQAPEDDEPQAPSSGGSFLEKALRFLIKGPDPK